MILVRNLCQKLCSIQTYAEINEKDLTVSYRRTDGRTDPKYRKTSYLKIHRHYWAVYKKNV